MILVLTFSNDNTTNNKFFKHQYLNSESHSCVVFRLLCSCSIVEPHWGGEQLHHQQVCLTSALFRTSCSFRDATDLISLIINVISLQMSRFCAINNVDSWIYFRLMNRWRLLFLTHEHPLWPPQKLNKRSNITESSYTLKQSAMMTSGAEASWGGSIDDTVKHTGLMSQCEAHWFDVQTPHSECCLPDSRGSFFIRELTG